MSASHDSDRLRALHVLVPRSIRKSAVVREAQVLATAEGRPACIHKVTLDSGANAGSYVGRSFLTKLEGVEYHLCDHTVGLGDGVTDLTATQEVLLNIRMYDDYGELTEPVWTRFYVVDHLGDQAIIGLPDIIGDYFYYFRSCLEGARIELHKESGLHQMVVELGALWWEFVEVVANPSASEKQLQRLCDKAKKVCGRYSRRKDRISSDPACREVILNDGKGGDTRLYLVSDKHGVVFADSRMEDTVSAMEAAVSNPELVTGDLYTPWAKDPEICPEELDTPDPLSFNEDVLRYMELSPEEAQKEYMDTYAEHIGPGMMAVRPDIVQLLQREAVVETFAPTRWDGIKVDPVELKLTGPLPARMAPKARPIREALYDPARSEMERLLKYFYEKSTSSIASPLVIAPKATPPYICFCGDYREVNQLISIPQEPILIVRNELVKAAKFKVYIDLDMANSFHQIPLSEEFKDILSVQTPWGLVRPRFLPEGVGPASGILQRIVR